MKARKDKRNLKSANDHGIRKKVISPKLDLLRPSNTNIDKKLIVGQNKIKNTPKALHSNVNKIKKFTQFSQKMSQTKDKEVLNPHKSIKIMELKEIQRNYLNNFESDNLCEEKLSSSRRSLSWGKLSDSRSIRRLSAQKRDNQTVTKQKPIRYEKFAFRSQKYLKLSSEAKTLTNEDYQENTRRLNQDIDYYKKMYIKSLKALTKIEKIMTLEKCKFETERKVYEEQIKRLKNRVQLKKPTIGHIYSYKQFPPQKLIPQTLIVQRNDQNFSELNLLSFDKDKGQKIIDQYLIQSDEESSQLDVECLSIQSK